MKDLEDFKKVCADPMYQFLRWECRDIYGMLADNLISVAKAHEAATERKLGMTPKLPAPQPSNPNKVAELAKKLTDYNYRHGHPDYDNLSAYETIIHEVFADIDYVLNVEATWKKWKEFRRKVEEALAIDEDRSLMLFLIKEALKDVQDPK